MCILAFNPSSPGVYSIQLKSLNNAICIPVSSPHQRARHPMAVLHASQSILEKCAQTQGQTQVLMSQPAASVAAATQATHTTGISMVSTQAELGGRWRGCQDNVHHVPVPEANMIP